MGGVETVRGEAETRRAANVAFPQTTRRSRSSPQSCTVPVRSGRDPSSAHGSRHRPGRCWPADQRPSGGAGARSSPQTRAPASPTRLQPPTRHWTRSTATCACQHGAVPSPQPLCRSRCVSTSSQRCQVQASGCSADQGRLHRPAAAGTAQAWKKRGTRRRAAHRAVDHPLDHQQEEGPLGSLTHQVGSHHTRSVHDTARPRIQRVVVVQPARSRSQPPGDVPSHHRPLVHAAEFAAPRARPGDAPRRPYRAMPSIPDRA
jgi:hypothetical protein